MKVNHMMAMLRACRRATVVMIGNISSPFWRGKSSICGNGGIPRKCLRRAATIVAATVQPGNDPATDPDQDPITARGLCEHFLAGFLCAGD